MRILFAILPLLSLSMLTGCMPPLIKAARNGDTASVQDMLAQGADVNMRSNSGPGWTPLTIAACNGRRETAELLLQKGADPNQVCGNNMTFPLDCAAGTGNSEIVSLLLAHGADVNLHGSIKWPALTSAAINGKSETVGLLLKAGADARATDFAGRTAAQWAGEKGYSAIAEMILAASQKSNTIVTASAAPPRPRLTVEESPDEQTAQSHPAPPPTSSIDEPRYKVATRPNDFALVIGIGKYSNLPEAEFAERDAAAVREHLIALGWPEENIISMIGAKATRTAFAKNLESWLPRNVNENSTVFVYYSGHGAPDAKTGQAFLVPWDGDPEFLEGSAYPVKRLYEKLGALKAKRVIVALDACFSGAGGRSVLAQGTRPLVTKVDIGTITSGKLIALTAANADEITGTAEAQGHGAFTYYLLEGLNGAAKNASGQVTVRSLYNYLTPKVQAAAHRHNRDQTPQLLPASGELSSFVLR